MNASGIAVKSLRIQMSFRFYQSMPIAICPCQKISLKTLQGGSNP